MNLPSESKTGIRKTEQTTEGCIYRLSIDVSKILVVYWWCEN